MASNNPLIPVAIRELRKEVQALEGTARQRFFDALDEDTAAHLYYTWPVWARDKQLPPKDSRWTVWMPVTGRAWGKTRTGAETTILWAGHQPNTIIALVGKNPKDVRSVMVEGALNSILARSPPWFMPRWNSTKLELEWPNGSKAFGFSAETPDALRGWQFHYAWIDEFAKFKYPEATWDMLTLTMRLGILPRRLVTTTPRPLKVLVDLMNDPMSRVVTGALSENEANLPDAFVQDVYRRYAGTTLGRQEIYGEVLSAVEGALWTRSNIDQYRVTLSVAGDGGLTQAALPELVKVVLGVDPSMTSNIESDDTGLVMGGLGTDGHVYVTSDLTGPGALTRHIPTIANLVRAGKVDLIVAETNNGGDLVEATLRTVAPEGGKAIGHQLPYKSVHATRGKRVRAEPVANLYEQGLIHHVGQLPELEDELVTWVPDASASPNRMDALVWMVTELLVNPSPWLRVRSLV